MSALLDFPHVSECSIDGCSYNSHAGCHAGSVTIVDAPGGGASCGTFIPLGVKGGLDKVVGEVGACHRAECTHNSALECHAASVRIGSGPDDVSNAGCLTYESR